MVTLVSYAARFPVTYDYVSRLRSPVPKINRRKCSIKFLILCRMQLCCLSILNSSIYSSFSLPEKAFVIVMGFSGNACTEIDVQVKMSTLDNFSIGCLGLKGQNYFRLPWGYKYSCHNFTARRFFVYLYRLFILRAEIRNRSNYSKVKCYGLAYLILDLPRGSK